MQFSQFFAQNVAFFYEFYLHSSVDLKKKMLEARIKQIFFFESRGSGLYFDVLHGQIFIQQDILGVMKF